MTELYQALAQGLLIGSTYGLLALGMGLVYGVSGVVNFSHGDFISLGMFMCLALFSAFALDPYVSVLITVPVMTAIGALVYIFLIRPMVGHQFLMVVQLTLGLSLVLQNGILMIFGGEPARTPSMVESKLVILGDVVLRVPHIIAFVVSFALAIALYIMLRSTDFGRSIRAVHQNAHAASLMGINVGRVQVLTFALGIGILALAAALLLPGTPIQPTQGLRYTVITLLVVVLGGMTNFVGIMLGGLIIGIAEAFGTIYLEGPLGLLMPYIIFVAIMLFRPQGLTWSASKCERNSTTRCGRRSGGAFSCSPHCCRWCCRAITCTSSPWRWSMSRWPRRGISSAAWPGRYRSRTRCSSASARCCRRRCCSSSASTCGWAC